MVTALNQFVAAAQLSPPAVTADAPLSGDDIIAIAALAQSVAGQRDFDCCGEAAYVPESTARLASEPWLRALLVHTPQPAIEPPGLATFRNEYGLFTPVSLDLEGAAQFYTAANQGAFVSQARLGTGIGYASDSVVGKNEDGLAFLQVAVAAQNEQFALSSVGFGFQFRIPFAVIPGDILVWGIAYAAGAAWALDAFQLALRGDQIIGGAVIYESAQIRFEADLGREATFMWYWDTAGFCEGGQPPEPGALCDDGGQARYARWDATIPLLSLRVLHFFGRQFANDVAFQLAGRVGNLLDTLIVPRGNRGRYVRESLYIGAVLSIESSTRFYW